jgi:hypothetical protein
MFRISLSGLRFAAACTLAIAASGVAVVPIVSAYDPMVQNLLYAFGRMPILYIVYVIYTEQKNE